MESLDTYLQKLKIGSILRSIKKENTEPENVALDQVSKELRFLQRQSQYAGEIERVLKELRLTALLIKNSKEVETPSGVSRQELLAYHQGVFLTLVHQMKDKIGQLVQLMTEEKVPDKPSIENDISINDLLTKKQKILQELGIENEIQQWNQENPTSKIAVALRKRTHHHHRVSGLKYDKDFLNLGFTDIATQPQTQNMLSDYGKEQIAKMRGESLERLFTSATSKAQSTLEAIETSVEKVSEALIKHFNLPTTDKEIREIMDANTEMNKKFEIVNRCSMEKIPEPQKSFMNALIKEASQRYSGKSVTMYLVGSLGRGEYEEGYSDINIYIILDIDEESEPVIREGDKFSLKVFTKKQFLSESGLKYRIIVKTDGLLIHGEDIIGQQNLPKVGLLMALALNDDIIDNLNDAEAWMKNNPNAASIEIARKSRRLAKRLIDFIYGVVMSNDPQYTPSRRERVASIIKMYPADKEVIETLFGISKYGVGEFESFKNTIDGFRSKAQANINRMVEVKTKLSESKKNKRATQ